MKNSALLRKLIGRGTLPVPGVFNGASALLAQEAGFKALYLSGAGVANAFAGLPDEGLVPLSTVSLHAQQITRAVSIPLIVDVDTGFGNIRKTVAAFEQAGAAAIQIEDQAFPKRCGHLPGKTLVTPGAMARKISLAAESRKDKDLIIIARTDANGVTSMEDAILRARLYLKAGADVIFPEALRSMKEFKQFAKEIDAPLMANMTEFGKTPYLTLSQFEMIGYAIVIFPMTAFRVMMNATKEAYQVLKVKETQKSLLKKMQTRKELYKLLKYHY